MTILYAVEDEPRNLTEATAKRLREELAGRNISKSWLATRLGVSKMWLTRRTQGVVPMTTEDLEAIGKATGISYAYLVTGIKKKNPSGGGPEGQDWPGAGAGPKTTKREPLDYMTAGSNITKLFPERIAA